MIISKRSHCEISGNEDLEHLYTFSDFPVSMKCTDQNEDSDLTCDMSWYISKSTGLIHLKELIPLDILYSEDHNSGVVGNIWREHHKEFSKFILKFKPKSVFEIGGAHGILASEYNNYYDLDWTILEPNPSPIKGSKAKFIKNFFSEKYIDPILQDTVVHSHVLEHIYEPNNFMKLLKKKLTYGKLQIFSVPNMRVMLSKKYTNCLNFEHTLFLTEIYINAILNNNGFRIIDKEYFKKDHSIFFATVREEFEKKSFSLSNEYKENKNIFLEFIKYHKQMINEINLKIKNITEPIYLFGGHIFSQYLFSFGLNKNKIKGLIDNDSKKHNKRLYGTDKIVFSPEILKDLKSPLVILKAGVYNNEIKEQILNKINKNVKFI